MNRLTELDLAKEVIDKRGIAEHFNHRTLCIDDGYLDRLVRDAL